MKIKSFITLKVKHFFLRWKKEKEDMKKYKSTLPKTPLHNKVGIFFISLFYILMALLLSFVPADAAANPSLAGTSWRIPQGVTIPSQYGQYSIEGYVITGWGSNGPYVSEFSELALGYIGSGGNYFGSANQFSLKFNDTYVNLSNNQSYEIYFLSDSDDSSLDDFVYANFISLDTPDPDPDPDPDPEPDVYIIRSGYYRAPVSPTPYFTDLLGTTGSVNNLTINMDFSSNNMNYSSLSFVSSFANNVWFEQIYYGYVNERDMVSYRELTFQGLAMEWTDDLQRLIYIPNDVTVNQLQHEIFYSQFYYQGSVPSGDSYEDGYNDGYQNGYNEGMSVGFSGNFFSEITKGLDHFKIIGEYSALNLVQTFIGLAAAILLLKLFAGG